jgi:hypothetical protein
VGDRCKYITPHVRSVLKSERSLNVGAMRPHPRAPPHSAGKESHASWAWAEQRKDAEAVAGEAR